MQNFLGIHSQDTLETHPNRGASWASFLIEQLIVALSLIRPACRFWYWRTAGRAEVDLLIEAGGSLIPVEMKLHSSPARSLTGGLISCLRDLGLDKGFVIYPGKETYPLGNGISVLPAADVLRSPAMLLEQV